MLSGSTDQYAIPHHLFFHSNAFHTHKVDMCFVYHHMLWRQFTTRHHQNIILVQKNVRKFQYLQFQKQNRYKWCTHIRRAIEFTRHIIFCRSIDDIHFQFDFFFNSGFICRQNRHTKNYLIKVLDICSIRTHKLYDMTLE